MTDLTNLLDPAKVIGEDRGVFLTDVGVHAEVAVSKSVWEGIYDFDLAALEDDRRDFTANKLDDHLDAILRHRTFGPDDVYLEIGCGPAYIGEHIMRSYGSAFVGIDFNLRILHTLREFFDKSGLTNYLLIHADINAMPLRNESVDFIYGGGVIEHFADTAHILRESWRVLRPCGVSFNSVPAFNLSWLPVRFNNNIPATPPLREILTFVHMRLLRNRLLERNYGYELSFTARDLERLHRAAGFSRHEVAPLAFHPSPRRMPNATAREWYFRLASKRWLAPVYYAAAVK